MPPYHALPHCRAQATRGDLADDAIETLVSTLQLEPGSLVVEAEIAERTVLDRTPVRATATAIAGAHRDAGRPANR